MGPQTEMAALDMCLHPGHGGGEDAGGASAQTVARERRTHGPRLQDSATRGAEDALSINRKRYVNWGLHRLSSCKVCTIALRLRLCRVEDSKFCFESFIGSIKRICEEKPKHCVELESLVWAGLDKRVEVFVTELMSIDDRVCAVLLP